MAVRDVPAAATPSTRLAVDTMPSLAPSTAARGQLERWLRWTSDFACAGCTYVPPLQPVVPTRALVDRLRGRRG
jgi:hypothetical protein